MTVKHFIAYGKSDQVQSLQIILAKASKTKGVFTNDIVGVEDDKTVLNYYDE